ncbi:MAG: hypothetical protein MZV70_57765 [Desulfobacterales bacterium]|nr:hypothetical protein [Desulfobacterales bacterium]
MGEAAKLKVQGYRLVTLSCTELDATTAGHPLPLRQGPRAEAPAADGAESREPVPSISPVYFAALLVENEIQDFFGLRVRGPGRWTTRGMLYLEEEALKTPYCRFSLRTARRPQIKQTGGLPNCAGRAGCTAPGTPPDRCQERPCPGQRRCDPRAAFEPRFRERGDTLMRKTVIPFGPQHPVLPEPIHLKLTVEDERITEAIPNLGYVHRGPGAAGRRPRLPPDDPGRRAGLRHLLGHPRPVLLPGDRGDHGRRGAAPGPVPAGHVVRAAPDPEPPAVAGAVRRQLRLREPVHAVLARSARGSWTSARPRPATA